MEHIYFDLMAFPDDKTEIALWQESFKDTQGWDRIYKYILEDGLIHGLNELIATNYEIFPIGDDEVKLALSIRNQDKAIVGFVICQEFNIKTTSPELFLQYIVIRPDMQNKGIGKFVFKHLPDEVGKLTGKKPVSAFSYIHNTNLASQKLYTSCGFSFEIMTNSADYVRARGNFQEELVK